MGFDIHVRDSVYNQGQRKDESGLCDYSCGRRWCKNQHDVGGADPKIASLVPTGFLVVNSKFTDDKSISRRFLFAYFLLLLGEDRNYPRPADFGKFCRFFLTTYSSFNSVSYHNPKVSIVVLLDNCLMGKKSLASRRWSCRSSRSPLTFEDQNKGKGKCAFHCKGNRAALNESIVIHIDRRMASPPFGSFNNMPRFKTCIFLGKSETCDRCTSKKMLHYQ